MEIAINFGLFLTDQIELISNQFDFSVIRGSVGLCACSAIYKKNQAICCMYRMPMTL